MSSTLCLLDWDMDSAGDEKEMNLISMVMISKLGHYITKLP